MTACTNHGGKARRVVTAALVGVLSVGTVPMVALAEGVSDGIQTLSLSAQDAFKQGKMTEARDKDNRPLDIPADGIVTVEAGNYVVPTEITPKDGSPVTIVPEGANKNADINFYKEGYTPKYCSWETRNTAGLWDAGTYTVEVKYTFADGTTATFTADFIVEDAMDLSKATIYDKQGGVSDTTFAYNGKAQTVGVAVNGKALNSGYTVRYTQKLNANGTDAGSSAATADFTHAGTYVANIYEGSSATGAPKAKVTFVVNPADLSTANVSVSDVDKDTFSYTTDAVKTVYVDGNPFTVASNQVKTVASAVSGQTGKASVVVTPGNAAMASGDVTGKATVEFNVVDTVLSISDVKYNGSAIPTGGISVNLADGDSFKPERIEVFGAKKLDSSYYTVTYTDSEGNAVEASALSVPGKYKVHVRVNAEASHFEYGSGDMAFDVTVSNGIVTEDDIVFKFDGKVGSHFEPTYDGTDMLEKLETIVHTKWGDDLVAGTDYTVTVHNEETDEDVEQIVDAGTYTVTVNVPGFKPTAPTDNTCTIHVKELELDYIFVGGGNLTQYTYDKNADLPWWANPGVDMETVWYLSYTGDELEPGFELGYYTDKDGEPVSTTPDADDINDDPSGYTWHALPADVLEVTGYTFTKQGAATPDDVKSMKDLGTYRVKFALNSDNYVVNAKSTHNVITVSDKAVAFADVDANAWYAKAVFQAKQLGYVSGVSGTNLYAPEAEITRADALVIISRMAGFDQTVKAEDYLDENGGYVTRYVDVDKGAYYAKAIAWGTKVGIVSGYQDGSGKFGPTDPITREQFAAMLCNYAKATGDDVATDGSALAALPDAGTVSDWAESAVAWAVDAGVMGNNGSVMGQNQITRGEVAAMAVNYQPEGAGSGVIG